MQFKNSLLESGILDSVGIHHEFASGAHGRKLDFDLLADDSELYALWVEANVHAIKANYSNLPSAIIGVANGTNRLTRDVGMQLGIPGLFTYKADDGKVEMTEESLQTLNTLASKFILVLEDVGTTGGTACSVALNALDNGAEKVEILFTWQRTEVLALPQKCNIPYNAIIKEVLPTYSPELCSKSGYCSMGWKLVTRS